MTTTPPPSARSPFPVPRPVRIHYRRPPDRVQEFRQRLVHEAPAVLVTYLPRAGVSRPSVVAGRTILEAASPVVWLTFPGAWHDIGLFHTPDGIFTGLYANILTPVRIVPGPEDRWWTTDLFLDVFLDPAGRPHLLDGDELEEARREGWIEPETAARAEEEAARLVADARSGSWPPPVVDEWTLERARAMVGPGAAGAG